MFYLESTYSDLCPFSHKTPQIVLIARLLHRIMMLITD